MKNFVEELRWRGMLQDIMPGTEEMLNSEMVKGYIGFDPTADSLGVGNLVQIMTLMHFQKAGHKPIALVGGATGMVGDPSGKSLERNLLNAETLQHNLNCQQKQLEKFLDFNCGANSAEIVNNYDWFKNFTFLDFIRDVGKHISVNYMMAKDSVKNRLENGMSFTEFSYQLVQGYDFYYLWKNNGIKLQMGGSDQWGNIVTGTELIRRKDSGEAFALTTPLIKKSDGTKFGKTEGGNVWLDPKRTSPYQFYQFWLNASDEDSGTFIRIFSLKSKEEIEAIEAEHAKAPHQRHIQKELAKEITARVHSEKDLQAAIEASEILFGKGTQESLMNLSEDDLLSVFSGVPKVNISLSELEAGMNVVEFLSDKTQIFPSRGEARKMIQGGGVLINKNKVEDPDGKVSAAELIRSKYILAQKGKKNYYLVIAS
ncbi:MAG: tyrosine--tRNA ligase [Bacteroidetes bacterium]|nr:tyrosine--tRNA ligase [Bacteroidota bacterium]